MNAFGEFNVLALLAIAVGAAVGALLGGQRSVVAYGSRTRSMAAALAGGLVLSLPGSILGAAYGWWLASRKAPVTERAEDPSSAQ